MYPSLQKSYKKRFPFRICTTSYIYPDYIYPNAERLAPYLDEIELLMFESSPEECLPSKQEIQQLAVLRKAHDLSFQVHLPIDIAPTHEDRKIRRQGIDVIRRVFDLSSPLLPSSYILHLPWTSKSREDADIKRWREHCRNTIAILKAEGIPGESLAVETLDYPIEWAEPIISAFDLSVCIDIGHLLLYGFDFDAVYRKYSKITRGIHLHGVKDGRDHLALDVMDASRLEGIIRTLKGYTETLSLEVFSFRHLASSLAFFETCWEQSVF